MDEGLDTGPIVAQERVAARRHETRARARGTAGRIAARRCSTRPRSAPGSAASLTAEPQPDDGRDPDPAAPPRGRAARSGPAGDRARAPGPRATSRGPGSFVDHGQRLAVLDATSPGRRRRPGGRATGDDSARDGRGRLRVLRRSAAGGGDGGAAFRLGTSVGESPARGGRVAHDRGSTVPARPDAVDRRRPTAPSQIRRPAPLDASAPADPRRACPG